MNELIKKIEALKIEDDGMSVFFNYNSAIEDVLNTIKPLRLPNKSGTWLLCHDDTGRGTNGYEIRKINQDTVIYPKGDWFLLESED
jgi:hypothetical protein